MNMTATGMLSLFSLLGYNQEEQVKYKYAIFIVIAPLTPTVIRPKNDGELLVTLVEKVLGKDFIFIF